MKQEQAKQIYNEIKERIENCINDTQLSALVTDAENARLNKLLREYPVLHDRLMSLINNKESNE